MHGGKVIAQAVHLEEVQRALLALGVVLQHLLAPVHVLVVAGQPVPIAEPRAA